MILDSMKNIGSYAGISENFATAVRYLQQHDLAALPMGRTVVDGDKVYINKNVMDLQGECKAWEAHRRYADLQIIIDGCERFGWGIAGSYGALDESRDFMDCFDVNGTFYDLTAGKFTVFLPEEPHSPCNFVAKRGEHSVKLVVKVLME